MELATTGAVEFAYPIAETTGDRVAPSRTGLIRDISDPMPLTLDVAAGRTYGCKAIV
jgi:hypothetical protein